MIGDEVIVPVGLAPDVWPVLAGVAGVAAVGGWLYWRHRRRHGATLAGADDFANAIDGDGDPPHDAPIHVSASLLGPPTPPPGRWVVPVARWQGRTPVVSDGWGSPRDGGQRRHRGVDIMFRRRTRTEFGNVFPPRAPHSRWHFMPPGTLVLAASDADVWSAGWTPRGYSIVLSHGAPWATYYTHLASLRVRETRRGASKERVRAGQPLGVVGADPTDTNGIAHLHFEMWFGGGASAAVDPLPFLRRWPALDAPEVA